MVVEAVDGVEAGFIGPLGETVQGVGREEDAVAPETDVGEEVLIVEEAEPVVIALSGAAGDLLDDGDLGEQLAGVVRLHVEMVGAGAVEVFTE